jgi:hypothetical protein
MDPDHPQYGNEGYRNPAFEERPIGKRRLELRVVELLKENDRLRAHLAELRQEVERLRAAVRAATKVIEDLHGWGA